MPVIAVSALVGILAGLWIPVLDALTWWPVLLFVLAPLCWWLGGMPAAACLSALALAAMQAHEYSDAMLHPALTRQDIVVTGYVAEFPRTSNDVTTALFAVESADAAGLAGQLVRINVYGAEPQLHAGAGWRLLLRLKRPHSTANPGSFDRELWNLRHGIVASGYVRASVLNRPEHLDSVTQRLLLLRSRVRDELLSVLQTARGRELVPGIVTGTRDEMDAATWEVLRLTGTSHLLAISGLHIALVALLAWFPGRLLGWLAELCGLTGAAPWLPRITVMLSAALYTVLAGMTVPTVRAFVMVLTVLLLAARHRPQAATGVLTIALLLVLSCDPLAVLAPGFWLSFLAVAALAFTVSASTPENPACAESATAAATAQWRGWLMQRIHGYVKRSVVAQCALLTALALPTVVFFGQISLAALPANLVAIPLFSLAVLPALLSGTVLVLCGASVGSNLLQLGEQLLLRLYDLLQWLATLPGVMQQPAVLDAVALAIGLLAAVAALLPQPLPGRLLGAGLLLSLLLRTPPQLQDMLRINVIDVGQGLAVLVSTRQHRLLYDAGPGWRGGDAGQTIVVPYLRNKGISQLDALLISHDDADHSGGARSILAAMPVSRLLAPVSVRSAAAARPCRAGDRWTWDEVEFTVLHPGQQQRWSDNDSSCVLLIRAGTVRVLLPGDIEQRAERHLLQRYPLADIDLVLAPHHGSATSSSAAFVAALARSFVVFSVGYANRWGFPKAAVTERWQKAGNCLLTTAAAGELEFATHDGRFLHLRRVYRAAWSRPWVLRKPAAAHCSGTINGLSGGL